MPILPVLDVLHGQVVRGVAGRRSTYRPIVSRLTRSTEPLDVMRALAEQFGFRAFYLADLDAIMHRAPVPDFLSRAADAGFHLWVDRGIRTADDAMFHVEHGGVTVIAALESLAGLNVLGDVVRQHGPSNVAFSLDMLDGRPLGALRSWGSDRPEEIVRHAVEAGVERLIVLDLASVGVNAGPTTTALCARLRRDHPHCEITTGGGVRGVDDVRTLYDAGADYVLVASALHDGQLSATDVDAWAR